MPKPSCATVSSLALGTSKRWDAGFHILAKSYETRVKALQESLGVGGADAALAAVPIAVLRTACEPLIRGAAVRQSAAQIRKTAQTHPYLALALVEAALPGALLALKEKEAQALQDRQSLIAWGKALQAVPGAPAWPAGPEAEVSSTAPRSLARPSR